ncbi:purine-nucleoside phosphorylase [Aureibaculum sp. 2210JD6-5]|uniref:purine-nucleoside phosphorylase n=1 Tax=Aureibaculum sp. 2210JD6-5 TaxID=3103957 RepID=UPI002AAD5129|nr:purine-nucleoside phosphorylase [Aureibaculum sp. 2210JD6-5]MDY7396133.1 purine-nucleoside phosphorylase [Aureibaculum sp. 2210JD6-5]
MWNKVQETVSFLKEKGFLKPDFGIVLGSGLGGLVDSIAVEKRISYSEIPNFSTTTTPGHSGNLIYGTLSGKKVIAMQGRFHYYEGWSIQEVVFPIRVLKFLGVENLIVSNAAGGVNPNFKVGDIMIIKDHINMMPNHPLRGANDKRFGPRFVDMHEPYNLEMIAKLKEVAKKQNISLKEGVYLGLQGPTFETPAEYKMVKLMGADAVGMSTVPEVIVAKHLSINVLGLSIITDLGIEGKVEAVSHKEVQQVAQKAGKIVSALVEGFVGMY